MNFKQISNKESDWDSLGKFSWCESVANMKELDLWYSIKLLSVFCLNSPLSPLLVFNYLVSNFF